MHALMWLALIVHPAFAQIQAGSVGVAYLTDEKIALAADSRVTLGKDPPRDDACKVTALGGKMVLVATGAAGYVSRSPLIPSWSTAEEARRAFQSVQARNPDTDGWTGDVAVDLAKHLAGRFSALLKWERSSVVEAAAENGALAVALLGGRGYNGHPELFQVAVTFGNATPAIAWKVSTVTCPLNDVCAIGKTDVVTEFAGMTSARARWETASWATDDAETAARDYAVRQAMRLVQLTMKYQQGTSVGGPIDAAELEPEGRVRWYARKQNCPGN
jgi:hypothetical protein